MREFLIELAWAIVLMLIWAGIAHAWEWLGGPPHERGFLLIVAGSLAIANVKRWRASET